MSDRSTIAVDDSSKLGAKVANFITGSQRIEICLAVPEEDWDRFIDRRYVAVSATTKRILDGDDDEIALIERVSAKYADHRIFNAPGKTSS